MDGETSQFGVLLQQYRKAAGLTQEELAERAQLSVRGISNLESGGARRPHRSTMARLVDALQLPPMDRAIFEQTARGPLPSPNLGAGDGVGSTVTLPFSPTAFIGRVSEVEGVRELLRQEGVRLLTLTGAGGSGKTRLATEAARGMGSDFMDGIVFVPLAPLTDAGLVLPTIGATLDIRERSDESILGTLIAALQHRRLLLVLDNFEHLLSAVDDIGSLVSACPVLTLLVTSRIPLRLAAEREYPVGPLPVPHLARASARGTAGQSDAIRLFVERAQAVRPEFELTSENDDAVVRICRQMDGLPLAIELAAARVRTLPPEALAERLSTRLPLLTGGPLDAPARQQTLRATIQWSYSLLDEWEKTLFARLAVFSGGWSLAAAEAVCSGEERLPVLDVLTRLIEKSMVQRQGEHEPRFTMFETIREYAAEKLDESGGREQVQRRHAQYFTRFAEETEPQLTRAEQKVSLARLDQDLENLREALRWSVQARSDLGQRLAGALWRYWYARGYWTEGRRWLEAVLTVEGNPQLYSGARAKALHAAGILAADQDDYDRAGKLQEESLKLYREACDAPGIASSVLQLAHVAFWRGNQELARELREESLRIYREAGDLRGAAVALHHLGSMALMEGDTGLAEQQYEESLRLGREVGDPGWIATSLSALAGVANMLGKCGRAEALCEESLRLYRELGDTPGMAEPLRSLANIVGTRGNYNRAEELTRESLRICQRLGDRQGMACSLLQLGVLAGWQDEYEHAEALIAESLQLSREVGDTAMVGRALLQLGYLAQVRDDHVQAETLMEEGLRLGQDVGDRQGVATGYLLLGFAALEQGNWKRARLLHEESLRLSREIGHAYGEANALTGLATIAGLRQDHERATELLAAADAIWANLGAVRDPCHRRLIDAVSRASRPWFTA